MTKTLLTVLAHPDDESFGLGGTLALYSQRGFETVIIARPDKKNVVLISLSQCFK